MAPKDRIAGWARWSVGCARRPGLTLTVVVLLSGLALVSALRLKPSASLESLYDGDDPASIALKRLMRDFGSADRLTLLVQLPEDVRGEGPAVESMLAFARRFEKRVSADAEAQQLIASVAHRPPAAAQDFLEEQVLPAALYYLDDKQFQAFRERISREGIAEQMQRNQTLVASASPLAKQILKDPLRIHQWLLGRLSSMQPAVKTHQGYEAWVSPDGRALLIRVAARHPVGQMDRTKQLMKTVHRLVDEAGPGPLRVDYAGGYAMAELSEKKIRGDMIRSITASLILLQLIFWIAYRGLGTFPMAIAPVAAGLVWAFGVYGLTTTTLTPVTAVIGALLAGLGVDYCIHSISHYRVARMGGAEPLEAVDLSGGLGRALVAACVTSVIAFGVIWVSQIQALRSFSIIGVLGLIGIFIATVTLLPALMVWQDRRGGAGEKEPIRFEAAPLIQWVDRHRRAVLVVGTLVLLVLIGLSVLRAEAVWRFDDGLWQMHPRPNPPLATQKKITERFAVSRQTQLIHIQADSSEAMLARTHRAAERLDRSDLAIRTLGLHTLLPDPRQIADRRAALQKIDVDRVVGDFRSVVEQTLFSPEAFEPYLKRLKKMLRPGPPPSVQTLRDYPSLAAAFLPRASAARQHQSLMLVTFKRSFEGHAEQEAVARQMAERIAPVPGATLSGLGVVATQIRQAVSTDLPRLMGWALLAVAMWLGLIFRRPADLVLALLPMLFALAMLTVGMQWTGTRWHMVNLLAVPLLIGIGVDDGIFLVAIASRCRAEGTGRAELARRLAASCHAITMTSLTTGLAFGSLLLTSTPAIQSLGVVFAWGIVGCWAGSVFWLSALLLWLHRQKEASS